MRFESRTERSGSEEVVIDCATHSKNITERERIMNTVMSEQGVLYASFKRAAKS